MWLQSSDLWQRKRTSAGQKGSFAYEKNLEILIRMILEPEKAFIMGGSYKIPALHGLIPLDYIHEIMDSDTYKEASFNREYRSIWTGGSDESFYDYEKVEHNRTIVEPEWKSIKRSPETFYILAVDVARTKAETAILVLKVVPKENHFEKKVVNIHIIKGTHFQSQAGEIKKLAAIYDAESIVIDANGLGVGLLDFMVIETAHEGEIYGPIGVENIDDYKNYNGAGIPKLIYGIKTGSDELSTKIHVNLLNQLNGGRVKFLLTETEAKNRLSLRKEYESMSLKKKLAYMQPYVYTTELQNEIGNLKVKDNIKGAKVILERIRRGMGKDKFSALEYGLWFLKEKEEKYYKRRKKKRGFSKFIQMN